MKSDYRVAAIFLEMASAAFDNGQDDEGTLSLAQGLRALSESDLAEIMRRFAAGAASEGHNG